MNKPARPLWIIVKNDTGHMEVLRIRLSTGGKALPIFSGEDEAWVFLELGKFSDDWRVRETAAGELISILYCLCAGVDRVVLDPLPGSLAELNGLLSLRPGAFTKFASKSGYGILSTAVGVAERAEQSPSDREDIER